MTSIDEQLSQVKFNVSFLCVNGWFFEVREDMSHKIILKSPAANGEIVFDNPLSFGLFVKYIGGSIRDPFSDEKIDE